MGKRPATPCQSSARKTEVVREYLEDEAKSGADIHPSEVRAYFERDTLAGNHRQR